MLGDELRLSRAALGRSRALRADLSRVVGDRHYGIVLISQDPAHDRDRWSWSRSLVDLHMLVVCEGGRERSPQEVHELMRSVGRRPGRVRHSGLHMLLEGIADG